MSLPGGRYALGCRIPQSTAVREDYAEFRYKDIYFGTNQKLSIIHGRRENRRETERALPGHRLHRTTRHERECIANSGKNRAVSLRCIYEKAILRRYPLKDRFPGCGTGSVRFGGEELSATSRFKTSYPNPDKHVGTVSNRQAVCYVTTVLAGLFMDDRHE